VCCSPRSGRGPHTIVTAMSTSAAGARTSELVLQLERIVRLEFTHIAFYGWGAAYMRFKLARRDYMLACYCTVVEKSGWHDRPYNVQHT
jgi:hypothetical protein